MLVGLKPIRLRECGQAGLHQKVNLGGSCFQAHSWHDFEGNLNTLTTTKLSEVYPARLGSRLGSWLRGVRDEYKGIVVKKDAACGSRQFFGGVLGIVLNYA